VGSIPTARSIRGFPALDQAALRLSFWRCLMKTDLLSLDTLASAGLKSPKLIRETALTLRVNAHPTPDEQLQALLIKDPKMLTHQDVMFLMRRALAEMDKINTILKGILGKARSDEPLPAR
jgi:hypothetical protein